MSTPQDDKQRRIYNLLNRAEKLARKEFEFSKADWLNLMRPKFSEIAEALTLAELEDSEWSDEDIKSVLEGIIDKIIGKVSDEPLCGDSPSYSTTVVDLDSLRTNALGTAVGLNKELVDIEESQAETEYLKAWAEHMREKTKHLQEKTKGSEQKRHKPFNFRIV